MKVYISGKITGKENYLEEFSEAEKELKYCGYDVVNPAKHLIPGFTWKDYMKRDIALMLDCDFIYKIEGWEKSKGARLESKLCEILGIPTLEIKALNHRW